MVGAWHLTRVPVILVGLGLAALFLTVQLSINVPRKESVCPATNAVVTQDLLEQTVVR